MLGLLLYAIQAAWWPRGDTGPEPVVVDAAAVNALIQGWTRTTGRAPSEAEVERLIQDHVDQELLLRAARARGLHRSDALVQQRLIQNQRFVESSANEPNTRDADLLTRAYALGLERSDPVVRRRLIERMRQIIWAGAPKPSPATDRPAETRPPFLRLSHVFVSRDRHGAALDATAQHIRRELVDRRLEPGDPRVASLGDPLMIPTDLPASSAERVASRFGPGFAADVSALPTGQWSEPIASSYGLHLVWLHERPAAPPDTDATPLPTLQSAAARRSALEAALQELRQDVEVIRPTLATTAAASSP